MSNMELSPLLRNTEMLPKNKQANQKTSFQTLRHFQYSEEAEGTDARATNQLEAPAFPGGCYLFEDRGQGGCGPWRKPRIL